MSAVRLDIVGQGPVSLFSVPKRGLMKDMPPGLEGQIQPHTWDMLKIDVQRDLKQLNLMLVMLTIVRFLSKFIGLIIIAVGVAVYFTGGYNNASVRAGSDYYQSYVLWGAGAAIIVFTLALVHRFRWFIEARTNQQTFSSLQCTCSRYNTMALGLTFVAMNAVNQRGNIIDVYIEVRSNDGSPFAEPVVVGQVIQDQSGQLCSCGVRSPGQFCTNCGSKLMVL